MNQFYWIEKRKNGLCDVTIYDEPTIYNCEHGKEYDINEYTLFSIPYFRDLEINIREHFQAWKAHAIASTAQRDMMMQAVSSVTRLSCKVKRLHHKRRRTRRKDA
jgi:hypothetical protein